MSIFKFWSNSSTHNGSNAILEIFPLRLNQDVFVKSDINATYIKILTDVIERTFGIPKKVEPLLWDNYVQSEANTGLVSLLSEGMTCQKDLYLVYVSSVNVLRKATRDEEAKIKADYEKSGSSTTGVFISFKHYRRTEMLLVYSGLEYCVLSSLHKTMNLSKAVQLKMDGLRASVALLDSSIASAQAQDIATALRCGNDILLDAKDKVETAQPDTTATEKAIHFLDAKKSWILSLPLSYISGEQTGGIGATGEADMRAVERGLKQYFVSIIRPVLKSLFNIDTEFKTQDFRQMASALELLKTFELISNDNISQESKQEIIARVFDLDVSEEKKQIKKELKAAPPEKEDEPNPNQSGRFRGGQ